VFLTEQVDSGGKASELHSEGSLFESQFMATTTLIKNFRDFLQSTSALNLIMAASFHIVQS
jgi:hypothetical protein